MKPENEHERSEMDRKLDMELKQKLNNHSKKINCSIRSVFFCIDRLFPSSII